MSNPLMTRRVLFFTAGREPTAEEYAAEQKIVGRVAFIAPTIPGLVDDFDIRGDAVASLDPALIPAYYGSGEGNLNLPDVSPNPGAVPYDLKIMPGDFSAADDASPVQASLVGAELDENGKFSVVNLTEHESVSWSSSDDTKATVSEAGLITPVAPGETVITASYQYGEDEEENPLTIDAEITVTVTSAG